MQITIELPDDIANQLQLQPTNISRRILKLIAADNYRQGRIGKDALWSRISPLNASLCRLGVPQNVDIHSEGLQDCSHLKDQRQRLGKERI